MEALGKVTFDALIRKIVVSIATKSYKIRKFLEIGYHGNSIECFSFNLKKKVSERF